MILSKLEQLKELDAKKEELRLGKQSEIDAVLTDEIKAKLAAIDAGFDPLIDAVVENVTKLESEIKKAVLEHGATVKGVYTATYSKGRVRWNTKALDGYAAAHPEIEQFKQIGSPSVSIRRK